MKRILSILLIGFGTTSLLAQAPQKMSFQAVVRNASNALITNTGVGMQMSILQNSPTGIAVYIETHSAMTNSNGLATVEIGNGTPVAGNFTTIDWSAGPYYLKCETDPTGGSAYTVTSTTQLLSVPYALYAGNGFSGDYNDLINTPSNNTLDLAYDQGGAGQGRIITADAGAVEINTAVASGIALRVQNTNTGVAIMANSTSAANTFSTIQSSTASTSTNASAIIGNTSGGAWAVSGQVQQTATAQAAVYGSNLRTNGGHGVYGIGYNGLVGETNYSNGNAIYGENYDAIAPLGDGIGVAGRGYYGVFGEDRYLGTVAGAYGVLSNGNFGATGTKSFIIDHPSDPANLYLRHFSTESNEVLNMYRGNVVLDANGEAVVELPAYYDAINMNPSYHLTPIGGFAQVYVKEEITDGKFVIAGGSSGLKVSWAIYAERNDPYLQQYPEQRAVELEKREGQKGLYFMPQLYNQPAELKISPSRNQSSAPQPILELQGN